MLNPRIFALLIGVDNYKADLIPNLRGCVADVCSVRDFLVECLQTPLDNIRTLTNLDATREAIILAFKDHFIANNRITSGDAVVFYFAGRGSRVTVPAGWVMDDSHVETICPHDETASDENLPPVFGISTRTIGALFYELVGAKCPDNVSMILDCSHYGTTQGERIARCHENSMSIPATLDSEIWGQLANSSRQTSIPCRFVNLTMPSLVVLVPCRQNQLAYELEGNETQRGAFTHAVVCTLRKLPSLQMTYTQLINWLPSIPGQNPECKGDNELCLLFTSIPQYRSRTFHVRKSSTNDLEVNAGRNEGVVNGTEFSVLSGANPSSAPLAIFFATSVTLTTCRISPRYPQSAVNLPPISYAVVTRWKSPEADLAFFIASGAGSALLSETITPTRLTHVAPFNVTQVPSASDADIVLRIVNGTLHLTKTHRFIGAHAGPYIQGDFGGTVGPVLYLLRSAAHFRFYLALAHKSSYRRNPVKIELSQLKESDDGVYILAGGNIIRRGHARIILNDEPYGLTVRNKSDRNLFPSLFYFDPSDHSIQPWYTPSGATTPLRSKSDLIVHGNQDGHVIKFTLEPGEVSDTGFLILYLSSRYDDMSYLLQHSTFEAVPQPKVTFDHTVDNGILRSTVATVITVVRRTGFETKRPPDICIPLLSYFFRP